MQESRRRKSVLIEISPVDVVVFDGRRGRPVSINREVRRLAEGLRTADRPVEELAQIAT